MNEINEEIKLTLNLMQGDIYEGSLNELQYHLMSLLEIKRNELQQRLAGRAWAEPVTHDQEPIKSGQIDDKSKPLTAEGLKAGGWWCKDVSSDCANALESKGLRVFNSSKWGDDGCWGSCGMDVNGDGDVTRGFFDDGDDKQIHRIGNEFYWSEK